MNPSTHASQPPRLAAIRRREVIIHALTFIAGFTLVFVAAGATASALGQIFAEYRQVLTRIFGVVVILLGLNMLGLFRLPFLAMDRRVQIRRSGISYLGSFLAGVGFAAGWTPCIGPILAGVLALASAQQSVAAGTGLLFIYSMGLALPLLLLAIGLQYALPLLARLKRLLPLIDVVAGLIVLGVGVVLFTNSFLRFTAWLYQTFPAAATLGTGPSAGAGAITAGAAFAAGLVSCISPCVLPLLPAYLSLLTGQSVESLVASYEGASSRA
ncbi:MAG: cytochrome c biogenesis protein CcdA [bacterium]|nr:cytochrome c biogenesis protein CcdA [bacterium]